MSVKFGVLALLAEEPRHGYELKTALESRTGGHWAINVGQIYTTLQRLERDGLVEPAGTRSHGRNESETTRLDYRITTAGQKQLGAWFETPVVPDAAPREELTVKVLLAVAASEVDVSDVIQSQRRASVQLLQAYTRRKAQADAQDMAFLLMIDALIYRTESEIRWLDAAEARIRHTANEESHGSAG